MSADNIIKTLWESTKVADLTDEQLKALCCGEEISRDLNRIADLMNGIGCLVDEDTKDKTCAGNFQSGDDIQTLLWGLASAIKASAEAVFVSSSAAAIIKNRATGQHPEIFGKGAKETETQP